MNEIKNPPHYNAFRYRGKPLECIEVVEHLNLGFHLGNALKFVWRCEEKGNRQKDLEKAYWYLERAKARLDTNPHIYNELCKTVKAVSHFNVYVEVSLKCFIDRTCKGIHG